MPTRMLPSGSGTSRRTWGAWLLAGALVAAMSAAGLAGLTGGQKCSIAKSKASVKKLGSKIKCYQKAVAAGSDVDPTCLTSAENKFDAAFAKAETPGACSLNGDRDDVEALVDVCVGFLVDLTLGPLLPPSPPQSIGQACAIAKSKAAVKKFGAKIKCQQKTLARGIADPLCPASAEEKFDAAIAKAELRGDCLVVSDGPTIEAQVDQCVVGLVAYLLTTSTTTTTTTSTLPPPGVCCEYSVSSIPIVLSACTMAVNSAACTALTDGAVVSGICTSAGTCGTGSPGNCCQINGTCVSGAFSGLCEQAGGVFDATKACTTAGCQAP